MPLRFKCLVICALALLSTAGRSVSDTDSPGTNKGFLGSPDVLALAIEIAPPQLERLRHNEESHDYVHCTVRESGQTWNNVGIHCRGNPAKEFASGKPDLIVTFDKFDSRQRFHSQRRLVLQASRNDPSYLSAPIGFELFRAARLPAPRCGFARVKLNERELGFYVVIEGVELEFLELHF